MPKKSIPIAQPQIGARERRAVMAVLKSGMLAQGPQVTAFEQEFGDMVAEGKPCVAVNSGTSGQHLGLLASGIGPGDEVIVPSFTFAATANSVALTGATPVFADISLSDYCLDPQSVEAAITSRTAAIMPVHLYGHPAPMKEITAIARKHSLLIFEDAAQAHLASLDGQRVGTFGSFAVFSFYPTKNMTSGEGGMVVCEDESLARKVRLLRNQGMEKQYENEVVGLNNRMTDIHAAIGREQLKKLSRWTQTRQRNASLLSSMITEVETPKIRQGSEHVFHQYTVGISENRDEFARKLKADFGVGTGIYYPIPNHLLESLRHYPAVDELPNTLRASREVLSLPVHPALTRRQIRKIAAGVNVVGRGLR